MAIIEVCEILIIDNNQRALLQLRDKNHRIKGSAKWGVIGGGREINETPRECIKRELQEELDLDIQPIFIKQVEDIDGQTLYRHFIYTFIYQGDIKDLSLQEGQRIQFFTLGEIMALDKVEWFERVYLPIIKTLDVII